MSTLAENLAPQGYVPKDGEFVPTARYFKAMDFLLYLKEDCSYRADRIDTSLTLLLHPSEDRAVGVKLKGFRFLFERIKGILENEGINLNDRHFIKLVSALEIAMASGIGEEMIEDAERQRRHRGYERAWEVVQGAEVSDTEWRGVLDARAAA